MNISAKNRFLQVFDFVTRGVEESLNRKNEISKQELRAERQVFEREMDTHALRISMECFTIMRISLRMLDLTVSGGAFSFLTTMMINDLC